MNKNGLIAAVAEKCGIAKKEAAEVVEATLDIITDSLKKGEKVQIVGFGCMGCLVLRMPREREEIPRTPKRPSKFPLAKFPYSKQEKFLKTA